MADREREVEYVLERLGSFLDEARRWTNEAEAHMLDVVLAERGFQRVPYWEHDTGWAPRGTRRPPVPALDPTLLDGGACDGSVF